MTNSLSAQIESLLFYAREPTDVSHIAALCKVDESTVIQALEELKDKLSDRGISLLFHDEVVQLVVAEDFSDFISEAAKKEVDSDLTSAQSEALSVIAYLAPVRKVKIDFIRGVNSRAVLRNLSSRGLITKYQKAGKTVYDITADTLSHLGVTSCQELPEYQETRKKLNDFTENDEVVAELESAET